MTFLLLLPAGLSFLMLAAHWLRAGSPALAAASILMCLMLLVRRRWAGRAAQAVLLGACVVWVLTTHRIIQERVTAGAGWQRAALILLAVAAFSLAAAALFQTPRLLERYRGR
jgi:hypothetical protein